MEINMKANIVFMGTPDIACAMLEQLLADDYHVVGVVTQPDKKVGRKQAITSSAVKQMAEAHHLNVFQPISIKEDYQTILDWQPDLIVTCAYGQFIPQAVLEYPQFGSINVHASLLPRYRGGAPIQWAIRKGESKTGISIMRMVARMDAGAIMAQDEVVIDEMDTYGSVYEKLKVCGASLLHDSVVKLLNHSAQFYEQDEAAASFAYNITKEDERISLDQNVHRVYDQMRSLIPHPCAYALIQGKKLKFHKVRKLVCSHDHKAGELCGMKEGGYAFAFAGGYVLADELQVEGKAKVDAKSFANAQGKSWMGQCLE